MYTVRHKIAYYETDKMGIVHHSNYVRWMEEGRVEFLERIGAPFAQIEARGLISPVLAISLRYRESATFGDEADIWVSLSEYNGIRAKFTYTVKRVSDGHLLLEAESEHCFLSSEGRILRLDRAAPDIHEHLLGALEKKE